MMGYGGFGNYGMGILGLVFQIMLVVGAVSLVVYLVRMRAHKNDHTNSHSSAEEIAAQRYARGEISEEEYKRIRDNL